MADPVISIVMPVFNEQQRLRRAIDSALLQSYCDWELVVVDDGSVDGTSQILAEAAADDNRVRVLSRLHAGIASSLNVGIKEARGQWIARMDADDLMRQDRLEVQLTYALDHPDAAIIGSLAELNSEIPLATESGMTRFMDWVNSLITPEQIVSGMFVDCPIPHPTFFFRRTLFSEVGFYDESGMPEDYEMILRLHTLEHTFDKVPEALVTWTDWAGRASRTATEFRLDRFRTLKIRYLKPVMAGRSLSVWGAGSVGKRFVRSLRDDGVSVHAIVDVDPRKIGQSIHGCPVVDPKSWVRNRNIDSLILIAAGAPGAREEIQQFLTDSGLTNTRDFIAVA